MAQSKQSQQGQLGGITLAQRVQQARETLSLSQAALAEAAHIPISQVQDIEAGIELFLSPAVRQKLARVLKVRPVTLKMLEKPTPPQRPPLSLEARDSYIEELLHFPDREHSCPLCGACLEVRLFQRRDLEDNLLVEVKAHCSQCLFKL
jgi:transcriptional regulator with XRE-family HTH domain